MPPITVERATLYEETLAEPMSSSAKRYNISDVALAKVCRKPGVPVPPRGYWARIRNGYKVTEPPLPKLPSGKQTSATVSPNQAKSRDVPEAREGATCLMFKYRCVQPHQAKSHRCADRIARWCEKIHAQPSVARLQVGRHSLGTR